MAKVQLRAGAAVDLLNKEELGQQLDDLCHAWAKFTEARDGTTIVHASDGCPLDASGNSKTGDGKSIYRVPDGYYAKLVRCGLDFPGSNAASLVTCDVGVYADSVTMSAQRMRNNVLPSVYEASESHAPQFGPGQRVVLYIGGSAASLANLTVYPSLQLILRPVSPRFSLFDPLKTG